MPVENQTYQLTLITVRAVYLFPQQTTVMDSCQVSVMDLDQLVKVLSFLYLVLKLQSCAVQNLTRKSTETEDYVKIIKFNLKTTVVSNSLSY